MLEHFFGSKTRLKLLQIFFRSPERPFYVRELSRLAEVQLHAIRRELANLEDVGLLTIATGVVHDAEETGNERSKYYRLNTDFLLFEELRSLVAKAHLLEEKVFIDDLKNKGGLIKLFLLTGQFTNDERVTTDLLLVGDIKVVTVEKMISEFEKNLDKSIRYTIMDENEFNERREIGDLFLYTLLEAKRRVVVDLFHLG